MNLNAAEFMQKTQEIKDPARRKKLTKKLRKSELSIDNRKR